MIEESLKTHTDPVMVAGMTRSMNELAGTILANAFTFPCADMSVKHGAYLDSISREALLEKVKLAYAACPPNPMLIVDSFSGVDYKPHSFNFDTPQYITHRDEYNVDDKPKVNSLLKGLLRRLAFST